MSVLGLAEARPARRPGPALALLPAALAATVGAALVLFPPLAVAGGLVGTAFAALVVRYPPAGALAVLVLVAVLPETVFARGLPFLGGELKATDALLVVTLAASALAALARRGVYRMPGRRTTLLLVGFLALAVASIATARTQGTPLKMSLLELRPLLSYLLVFPLVAGLRSRRDVEVALGVVFAASLVVAAEIGYRYVGGEGIVATYSNGTLRVTGTSFIYPMAVAVWGPALAPFIASRRIRTLVLTVAGIDMAALFFTLQRAAWLAAMVGIALAIALVPGIRRYRLAPAVLPTVGIALALVVSVNALSVVRTQQPLQDGLTRLESIGNYGSDSSSQHRFAEWRAAGKTIAAHPVTGIGLGSTITFFSPMVVPEGSRTPGGLWSSYYIHNTYIWFFLKLGLAALLFFALVALAGRSTYRLYRTVRAPPVRRLALGAFASLVAVAVLSAFGPHMNVDTATPYMALTIALAEVLPRLARREPA